MFNKRRSEIQIVKEILDISKYGAKKTEILYQGNMNHPQLQNYLYYLLKNDIIKEDIQPNTGGYFKKIYKNTEKGNNLLQDINKLISYFK